MANNKNDNSELTYPVLPGTVDKGRPYEVVFTASVVLELALDENVKDFWISSNNANFFPFDDVVIEVETVGGNKEGFAIQLKHGDRAIITNQITGNKGDFSIKKYFKDVKNSEGNAKKHFDGFKFLLFTNRNGKTISKRFKLEDEDFDINMLSCDVEKLFENYCPKNDASYRFEADNEEYRGFLENFFLYVNQLDVEQLEKQLSDKFQREFDCEKSIFTEYLKFITKWSQDEKKKRKILTKTWMKKLISTRLLSPFVQPFSFDSPNNSKKMDIFRRSINSFDITIFEEKNVNKIIEFWSVSEGFENVDYQVVNKVNTRYQIFENYIKNINDLTKMKEASMLLWLLDKCPLIVKYKKCVVKAIQLLKQAKIIVLYEEYCCEDVKNLFNAFQIFVNLANLKEKVSLYEELVKTFLCSLQGKQRISLETLIGGKDTFEEQITTNDLLLFLNEDFIIGDKEIGLPDIYIDRYFSRHVIDYKFLAEVDKDTVIIISNFNASNEHLKQFQMEDIETLLKQGFENKNESESRKTVYFCRSNCNYEKFKKICNKLIGKRKYHHFRMFNGKLEWICSRGGIENLKQFESKEDLIEEKELLVCDNNVVIICGDPGIGKTTSMKHLKNYTSPSFWTVLIFPKDHSEHFRKKQQDEKSFEKYILEEIDHNDKKLDFKVFQSLLKSGHVNFIWDGLDEISEGNLNTVLNVIEAFSIKGVQQYITSRNNLKNMLENRFSAIATTIKQFEEKEQREYIIKRLKCSEEELDSVFTKIQDKISFFKCNDILGIPLKIYMFTELFIQDRDKYSALLTNRFSLTDLYYHFILHKFKIYFEEKEDSRDVNDVALKRNQKYMKDRIKSYQEVAVQMCFSEEEVHFIDYDTCEEFLNEIREDKDNVGIITGISSDNLPNFIHSTYGEYFTALYLSRRYRNIPNLSQFLFKEKYKNIRLLFDLILAKDCPAHIAVLCKNFEALKECKEDSLTSEDLGGRHPLQLACSWGEMFPLLKVTVENGERYIIHEEQIDRVKKLNIEYQNVIRYLSSICSPEKTDEIYHLNSYSYADETLCFSNLAILSEKHVVNFRNLKNFKNIPLVLYYSAAFDFFIIFSRLEIIPNVYTQNDDSLLTVAASNGSLASCELLINHISIKVNTLNTYSETPLHKVCSNGHVEIVKLFINNKAKVDAVDKYGDTPLHLASRDGHVEIVKLLIDNKAQINVVNEERGDTPLHLASENGHVEIVKLLINNKAKIGIKNKWIGNTPLHLASENGCVEIVKLLINNKVKVNAVNKDGDNPLHLASMNGHVEIVKLLINNKALIHTVNKWSGCTPLHLASRNGHVEIVKLLIDNKANVDAGIKDGYTPLYFASENGHVEIVKLLIDNEATVDAVNKDGYTPLHLASRNGHVETVKLFIDNKLNVNTGIKNGNTPLHLASENGHVEVVKLLIDNKAKVDAVNKHGGTPLHLASRNEHVEIVKLLINNNAKVDAVNEDGDTLLHLASRNGHVEIVRLLINNNVNVDAVNEDGDTPLHLACRKRHVGIVKLLIDNKANLDVVNWGGDTPLHLACRNGQVEMVKLLIDNKAQVHLVNGILFTPLLIAIRNRHFDIVNLLRKN